MSATDSGPAPASLDDSTTAPRSGSVRPPGERLSQLPPADKAARLASQLRDPGLTSELEGDELLRVATSVGEGLGLSRRIDILEAYYAADGDTARGKGRRRADRFFLQHAHRSTTAAGLVTALAELAPEVG